MKKRKSRRALKRRYGRSSGGPIKSWGGGSLYQQLKALGLKEGRGADCGIDHHESDLYVLSTPETRAFVKASGLAHSSFRNNIDGRTWIDVPFAYDPFWARKPR